MTAHMHLRNTKTAHGLIQTARGLCTDEAPHVEIDGLLARAADVVKDVETERDRYRQALIDVLGTVWPEPDTWTPHDPNAECDEFCALMRTLHEAQALVEPASSGCSTKEGPQ